MRSFAELEDNFQKLEEDFLNFLVLFTILTVAIDTFWNIICIINIFPFFSPNFRPQINKLWPRARSFLSNVFVNKVA